MKSNSSVNFLFCSVKSAIADGNDINGHSAPFKKEKMKFYFAVFYLSFSAGFLVDSRKGGISYFTILFFLILHYYFFNYRYNLNTGEKTQDEPLTFDSQNIADGKPTEKDYINVIQSLIEENKKLTDLLIAKMC